jgi:hypothetical protein
VGLTKDRLQWRTFVIDGIELSGSAIMLLFNGEATATDRLFAC